MPPDFNGEAPDPSELLVTVLTLAGLTTRLLERGAAQQNETLRVLQHLETLRNDLRGRFEQQHQELQRMYAPESVRAAVTGARQALADFQRDATAAGATLKGQAEAAARTIWLRALGTAGLIVGVGVLVGVAVIGLSLHFVPNLDEVLARRAVLAQQEGHFITPGGQRWVQIDQVQDFCQGGDPSKCAKYGRVE